MLNRLIGFLVFFLTFHSKFGYNCNNPFWPKNQISRLRSSDYDLKSIYGSNLMDLDEEIPAEPLYGVSYDPLEPPNVATTARDLEDRLMERALRFFDEKLVLKKEKCYLVGLEDKSVEGEEVDYTLEESLTELSELAGAAGLTVVGSTYQRLQQPSVEYYIGPGKLKEIDRELSKLKCFCVVFDTELSPSQQKNLELSFNQDNDRKAKYPIKVVDRTALILDIFAQHARSREGQLQVQLALLSYRLPRLTNMWSHLERQAAGARGKSNGGVGLRGPGEKQLESDRRFVSISLKFKMILTLFKSKVLKLFPRFSRYGLWNIVPAADK